MWFEVVSCYRRWSPVGPLWATQSLDKEKTAGEGVGFFGPFEEKQEIVGTKFHNIGTYNISDFPLEMINVGSFDG